MLRTIGRVIQDCYKVRAKESSKEPYAFNIMKDPRSISSNYDFNLCTCFLTVVYFCFSI